MNSVCIDNRIINTSNPPYIIAEISANHNGSLTKALELIELAKECGADAVKIQTYTADTMTIDCNTDDFKIKGGLWDGYTLYKLYQEAHTPWEWHKTLFAKAKEIGITIFSTPFDETSVDFLSDLNTPAFKIASFEAIDLPLIEYIAKKNKPIILSTGMANLEEISEAINLIQKYNNQLVVLHCVSGYPVPSEQANIKTIPDLAQKFKVISGLSDHTMGTATAIASVALGAAVIEKHFIKTRIDKGPDSEFSIEPNELKKLVCESRIAWESLGEVGYDTKGIEESNVIFRRSIYVVRDMEKGEVFTPDCIRRIRPGFGLPPKFYNSILGKVLTRSVKCGTPLSWDLVSSKEHC